jgi:hypothetical protein
MPQDSGRSGMPGNERTMRPIQINTSNPALLQPGAARPVKLSNEVLGQKSVPGFKKGKFYPDKHKGLRSKGGY